MREISERVISYASAQGLKSARVRLNGAEMMRTRSFQVLPCAGVRLQGAQRNIAPAPSASPRMLPAGGYVMKAIESADLRSPTEARVVADGAKMEKKDAMLAPPMKQSKARARAPKDLRCR